MGEEVQNESKVGPKDTSLVTLKEYSAIYDMPASSILVAVKTGKLKSGQKIGRFWYVDRNEEIGLKKNNATPKKERQSVRRVDLTGQTFGRWTVLYEAEPKGNIRYWVCECSCRKHTRRAVNQNNLRFGKSRSCGCLREKKPNPSNPITSEEDTLHSKSSKGLLLRKHTEYEGISYDEDHQLYYVNFFYEGKFHFGGAYKKLEDAVAAKEKISPGSVKKPVKRKRRKEKRVDSDLRLRKHTEYEGISYSNRSKLYYANFFHNGEFHYGGAYEKLEDALAAKKKILGEG